MGRPLSRRTDAALVRAAQAGSADAVDELFRRHWPAVHRAAWLVVHDAAAAEDIAQEAFLSRAARARPLRPPPPARPVAAPDRRQPRDRLVARPRAAPRDARPTRCPSPRRRATQPEIGDDVVAALADLGPSTARSSSCATCSATRRARSRRCSTSRAARSTPACAAPSTRCAIALEERAMTPRRARRVERREARRSPDAGRRARASAPDRRSPRTPRPDRAEPVRARAGPSGSPRWPRCWPRSSSPSATRPRPGGRPDRARPSCACPSPSRRGARQRPRASGARAAPGHRGSRRALSWSPAVDGGRARRLARRDLVAAPACSSAATSGRTLAALDPATATVRWRLRPADGSRSRAGRRTALHIAYRAGSALRIVYGNGTHDVLAGSGHGARRPRLAADRRRTRSPGRQRRHGHRRGRGHREGHCGGSHRGW